MLKPTCWRGRIALFPSMPTDSTVPRLPVAFECAIRRICERFYEDTYEAQCLPRLRLSDLLRVELAAPVKRLKTRAKERGIVNK